MCPYLAASRFPVFDRGDVVDVVVVVVEEVVDPV